MSTVSLATSTWVAIVALSCGGPSSIAQEISREDAIEIARQEVTFEPDSVEAVLVECDDQEVWRVTFSGRLPGQPPELSEVVIVEVDATTGEIVSITRT